MVAFWSSFAPAALITSIKKDLNLSKGQIADSNVAAVLGGVVARLFIGKFMDTFGPRYAFLLCLWGTAPVVFAISAVRNFTEYALCRFFIAWSLASVIPCIQWTTNMYNGENFVLEFFFGAFVLFWSRIEKKKKNLTFFFIDSAKKKNLY